MRIILKFSTLTAPRVILVDGRRLRLIAFLNIPVFLRIEVVKRSLLLVYGVISVVVGLQGSGRVKVCECVVDGKYCRDLFVRTHGLQVYCDALCRRRDGIRKARSRQKQPPSDLAQSAVRV